MHLEAENGWFRNVKDSNCWGKEEEGKEERGGCEEGNK